MAFALDTVDSGRQQQENIEIKRKEFFVIVLLLLLAPLFWASIPPRVNNKKKMVVDITLQTEINKKENKLYPYKARPFHPNLTVSPLAGKFYARHDFADPSLADPVIENAILKKKMMLAKDKYKEPASANMEYGWYLETRPRRERFSFHYPKKSCWITRIGDLIAAEDLKTPKKIFNGVPFKV